MVIKKEVLRYDSKYLKASFYAQITFGGEGPLAD